MVNERQVVISFGGDVLALADVARELGVTHKRLVDAVKSVASEHVIGVSNFYQEWADGKLPISVRPCESRSLHKAYSWWCRQNALRSESEVILMRSLPNSFKKNRRWVRIGDHIRLRTMIEPSDWRSDPDLTIADALGDQRCVFENELKTLT